jgi:hypothetical protein
MQGMVRCTRAFASLFVVAGMLASAWATCVADANATPGEQMDCCQAGHDDCPMKDSAADCCQKSGLQIESQGTVVKAASLSAPIAVVLAWATLPPAASVAHIQRRISYDESPPGLLLSPPAYIAFSALLI